MHIAKIVFSYLEQIISLVKRISSVNRSHCLYPSQILITSSKTHQLSQHQQVYDTTS